MTGRKKPLSAVPCLYLGCFTFDSAGEPDQTGSFQVVVEADNPQQAADRCRTRLRRLRTSTTLFDRPTTVLLNALIQLTGSFKRGLLVNWESMNTPPPPDARLLCPIPEQTDHEAQSFGLKTKKAKTKLGALVDDEPFIDFGGRQAFRRAAEQASDEPTRRLLAGTPAATSKLPLIPSLRDETATARPSKERTRAEMKARKERRAMLSATLDELRRAGGSPPADKSTERAKRE